MAINLPILHGDADISAYMREVNKFEILSEEEEKRLAIAFHEEGDVVAAQKLVTSHLRLVVKIAFQFKNYGLTMMDLIGEGNLGLMKAVKKFDIKKGFRLSTYAMWWIKAYIQDYILKSWSFVRIGTSLNQKKLFFNLGKIKNKLQKYEIGALSDEHAKIISKELDVPLSDVVDMDKRLTNHDASLNFKLAKEDGDAASEMIDFLEDDSDSQEEIYIKKQDYNQKKEKFLLAFEKLNDREKLVIQERKLAEKPKTLEDLSQVFNVSKERVRQIEARALEKLADDVRG